MSNILTKYRSFWICLALTLATIAVFWQVYTYNFINYDDPDYVYKNPNIKTGITLKAVKWAFTAGYAANWHPLTWLFHMLDWQLFGSKAGGHHLTNLIFHIANTLLLFVVLKQMTHRFWPSAFVAALFALHPLHVESVAWVSERKDVLSTFFWMLTMWAYVRFVSRPKVTRYLLVVIFFALGLMAKPMLVTLPFVLLLLDYWPLVRISRFNWPIIYRLIWEKIPLIVLSAISSVIAFLVQRSGEATVSFAEFPLKFRVFNAFISYVEYIEKMFWPVRLAFFYPHPAQNVSVFFAVVSAVLLLAVTIFILRFAVNHRYLFTGWFWYLGTLMPVIGIVQVGSHAMADRYSYVTLTGLFIIIAWGLPELLEKWPYRKITLWTSSLVVLSVLAVLAHLQQRYWKDSMTLFQHALKVTNNNYKAYSGIAQTLLEQGHIEEAIQYYSEAVRISPDYAVGLNGLGFALYKAGRIDEAVAYYEKALGINPRFALAHANLGSALVAKGKFAEAIRHYKIALETAPDSTELRVDTINNLGFALYKAGRIDEAISYYKKALEINPHFTRAHLNLAATLMIKGRFAEAVTHYRIAEAAADITDIPGIHSDFGYALVRLGQLQEAVTEYREALSAMPNDPNALNDLGYVLANTGEFDEAISLYNKALQIAPDRISIRLHLGAALVSSGKFTEAVEEYEKVLHIQPQNALAHNDLGVALSRQGKFNEAVAHFNQAIQIDPNYTDARNNLNLALAEKQKLRNKTTENTKE